MRTENIYLQLCLRERASIFEKHVGIKSRKYKLNNYSTTPDQFKKYLDNMETVKKTLGTKNKKITKQETDTLGLLREEYMQKKYFKKEILSNENILPFLEKNNYHQQL